MDVWNQRQEDELLQEDSNDQCYSDGDEETLLGSDTEVNSVSVYGRTLAQVKKKRQDVQSLAKKKEVISTFSKSQLVGVDGDIDTCYEAVPVDLNKKIEATVTIGETADDTEIMPENAVPVDLNKKIEAAVTIGETADDTEIMLENDHVIEKAQIPKKPTMLINPRTRKQLNVARKDTTLSPAQRNPEPEKKRKKITEEDVHAMKYKVLEKQCKIL